MSEVDSMSFAERVVRLAALGRDEVNFDLGQIYSPQQWHDAEQRIGRCLPQAWLNLVAQFGDGKIDVKSKAYESGSRADNAAIDAFKVNRADRDYEETRIEIELHPPDGLEVVSAPHFFRDSAGKQRWTDSSGWVIVGSSCGGDYLELNVGNRAGPRPLDCEVAWNNHEVSSLTYAWPSIDAWLGMILEVHEHSPRRLLGSRLRAEEDADRFAEYRSRASDLSVKAATVRPQGSVVCPHCGRVFFPTDPKVWNGSFHTCGGAIQLHHA